jgi:hypothetical protein
MKSAATIAGGFFFEKNQFVIKLMSKNHQMFYIFDLSKGFILLATPKNQAVVYV